MKKTLEKFLQEEADKIELETAREEALRYPKKVRLAHYHGTVRKLELLIALISDIYEIEEIDEEHIKLVKK